MNSWGDRQRFTLKRSKYRMGEHRPFKRNRAQCNACKEVVESTAHHEFVTCKCGALSVDGGMSYLRRVFGNSGYTELSYTEEVPN